MTTLLSSTYAQEQAYNASLGGENEVPPNNSAAKVGHGLSQQMIQ